MLDHDELQPGESALAQLRLDRPLVAERGDPFVIRSYSPMTTIGGGKVIDPYPVRHRRFRDEVINKLRALSQDRSSGGNIAFVKNKLEELVVADLDRLAKETRLPRDEVEEILALLITGGDLERLGSSYLLRTSLQQSINQIIGALTAHQQKMPLAKGLSKARLKADLSGSFGQREYDSLLKLLQEQQKIAVNNEIISCFGYQPEPSAQDRILLDLVTEIYQQDGLQPASVRSVMEKAKINPARQDELFSYLTDNGILVKVNEELYFHRDAYQQSLDLLSRHFKANNTLTLAQFRDLTGSSRKFVQALLEHFDQLKLTRRVEDHRVAFKLKI